MVSNSENGVFLIGKFHFIITKTTIYIPEKKPLSFIENGSIYILLYIKTYFAMNKIARIHMVMEISLNLPAIA